MTKEELIQKIKEHYAKCGKDYIDHMIDCYGDPEAYTCNGCMHEKTCDYAWDQYNTGGDCLAAK